MNNELLEQKTWWKRNWKWFVPVFGLILISIAIFFSSGMDGVATDLAQAYADTELYEKALEKVKSNEKVTGLLGEIKPIDKMAIFEGQVEYTNNNNTVTSTVRIVGTKGNANMDISANRLNNTWSYNKIHIRIKKPIENKQTIKVVPSE